MRIIEVYNFYLRCKVSADAACTNIVDAFFLVSEIKHTNDYSPFLYPLVEENNKKTIEKENSDASYIRN